MRTTLVPAVILMALLVSACESAPVAEQGQVLPLEKSETGPSDQCIEDSDCWCMVFTGAEFLEGKEIGECRAGFCTECIYD